MARRKHVPQRMCIACRKVRPKRDLIRIIRTPDQTLLIDETGKAQGRGAYLCKQLDCWTEKGFLRDVMCRALKMPISNEDWALLQDHLMDLS